MSNPSGGYTPGPSVVAEAAERKRVAATRPLWLPVGTGGRETSDGAVTDGVLSSRRGSLRLAARELGDRRRAAI
jgi:hypothetical protein